ncbi:acyl--CoA ligase [bacterium]|nr:acyl--CoA ligase [candidate division CSSED10-310 bacterium]
MRLKEILYRQRRNNKIALVENGRTCSYRDLCDQVDAHLSSVSALTEETGYVGVFVPNSIDFITAYFTVAWLGKVIVPLNIRSSGEEMNCIVNHCRMGLIITQASILSILYCALKDLTGTVLVYCIDTQAIGRMGSGRRFQPIRHDRKSHRVAVLMQSSSANASCRCAMLTHKSILGAAASAIKSLDIQKSDRSLICLPLTLSPVQIGQCIAHLYAGAQLVLENAWYPSEDFFSRMDSNAVSNATVLPSFLKYIAYKKNGLQCDFDALRFFCVLGAPLAAGLLQKLSDRFHGVQIYHHHERVETYVGIFYQYSHALCLHEGTGRKPKAQKTCDMLDEYGLPAARSRARQISVGGLGVMKGFYSLTDEATRTPRRGLLCIGETWPLDGTSFPSSWALKNGVLRGRSCSESGESVVPNRSNPESPILQHTGR